MIHPRLRVIRPAGLLFVAASLCSLSRSPSVFALSSEAQLLPRPPVECKSLRIRLATNSSPVFQRETEILENRIQERTGITPTTGGRADCSVELAVRKGIATEGFRIEDVSRSRVRIVGNDNLGLLYGIGEFLRSNTYHSTSFTLGSWRGTSIPKKPIRGIYFATHFHNFYHDAPIAEVRRYLEDLSLWA